MEILEDEAAPAEAVFGKSDDEDEGAVVDASRSRVRSLSSL